MIRKLGFFLLGFALLCGTANANVIVDNFNNGATVNIKSEDIDRGGGFTSDLLFVSIPGGLDVNFQSEGYIANNFANGDQMVFTYSDFGGTGSTLGAVSGMILTGLNIPIAPNPTSDWNLTIGGMGFASTMTNPINGTGNLNFAVPGLSNATTLTLTFTYVGMGSDNGLTFGGSQTDFVAIGTAIPEPTTLMMFGTVVGIGLVNRRRRK